MTEGFDVGLEMSGAPARASRRCSTAMNHGGKHRHARHSARPRLAIDWNQVIFKGLAIKGIYGREMFETWYKMSRCCRAGSTSPAITHRIGIDDFRDGFEAMKTGNSGKVVMDW